MKAKALFTTLVVAAIIVFFTIYNSSEEEEAMVAAATLPQLNDPAAEADLLVEKTEPIEERYSPVVTEQESDETKEEYFVRRRAEIEKSKETGGTSQADYVLENSILNAEMGLYEQQNSPAKGKLKPEEKAVVKEVVGLMKTDKEAAHALLVASLEEESSPALYFLAGNSYAENRQPEKAMDFYMTALENEGELDSKGRRILNRNIGMSYVRGGKFEEAKTYLQKSIHLAEEPNHMLHGLMGLSAVNTGNYEAAEYHYKKAVKLSPNTKDWALGLSKALLNQEKYEDALSVMNELAGTTSQF